MKGDFHFELKLTENEPDTEDNENEFDLNPDAEDEKIYVGLMDKEGLGKECAVFSPYTDEIKKTYDPKTGNPGYFIHNRFAITISPLHSSTDPLLMYFTISE